MRLMRETKPAIQRKAILAVPVTTVGGKCKVDDNPPRVELVPEPLRDCGLFWQNLSSIRPLLIS